MKLLFDENFGRPLLEALKTLVAFSRERPEVRHILELQRAGAKDSEWVPLLATDGWIVLTCDRGKSAGPKLPQLCRVYGITHVLISGALHNSPQFEKARAVLAVWPELLALADEPKGERYSLRYTHARRATLVPRPFDGT
jgi:hypothetical protein